MTTNQSQSIQKLCLENAKQLPLKQPWATPELSIFGNVKSLTQGGPPGTGDSGAGAMTQSPNFS